MLDIDDATDVQSRRRFAFLGSAAALGLWVLAWVLATWPLTRGFGLDANMGWILLLGGALPWLMQWLAAWIAAAVLNRMFFHLRRGVVESGLTVLAWATLWWGWLAISAWQVQPREWAVGAVFDELAAQFGGGAFPHFLFQRAIGPWVNPLQLHGPMSMGGSEFIWVSLSTALLTLYWMWAYHWMNLQRDRRLPSIRQLTKLALAVLIFTTPAVIHNGLRAWAHWAALS